MELLNRSASEDVFGRTTKGPVGAADLRILQELSLKAERAQPKPTASNPRYSQPGGSNNTSRPSSTSSVPRGPPHAAAAPSRGRAKRKRRSPHSASSQEEDISSLGSSVAMSSDTVCPYTMPRSQQPPQTLPASVQAGKPMHWCSRCTLCRPSSSDETRCEAARTLACTDIQGVGRRLRAPSPSGGPRGRSICQLSWLTPWMLHRPLAGQTRQQHLFFPCLHLLGMPPAHCLRTCSCQDDPAAEAQLGGDTRLIDLHHPLWAPELGMRCSASGSAPTAAWPCACSHWQASDLAAQLQGVVHAHHDRCCRLQINATSSTSP